MVDCFSSTYIQISYNSKGNVGYEIGYYGYILAISIHIIKGDL